MAKTRVRAIFKGRVQGVFFRDWTRRKAIERGLTGWVKNLDNGDVEAIFEGERSDIDAVIEWLKNEHPSARVDGVDALTGEANGQWSDFKIEY